MVKMISHIVIVEDEKDIQSLLKYNLEKKNYKCTSAYDGESAIKIIRESSPDLILLDLMLPGIDGLDVCRILKNKEETQNIPIIMLTAKGEESDIVKGLETGADDYVTKPFSIKVLLARVKSLLRRKSDSGTSDSLNYENLFIHAGKREVRVENKIIDLTYTEFQILFILASHPNWVYTRNQLIDEIRGDDYAVTDRSIDFQFVGLRKKLGKASKFLKTVRGVGYRFLTEDN